MTSYSQKEGVMKIHNDFTLYFRVTPSGKRVMYFYAYDENGRRTQGRSTGQTRKTAAMVLVNRLLKEGVLLPKKDVKYRLRLFCIGFLLTELTSFCPTFTRLSAPSRREPSPDHLPVVRLG
jgi:hypothetical protein